MASYQEIQTARHARRMRLLGHIATASIAVMLAVLALTACSKAKESIEYQHRAELTRCQEGYTGACESINKLGGV